MSRCIRVGVFLLTVFIMAACVPVKTVDISQYQQLKVDKKLAACKPPSYVIQHKKPRVAILAFRNLSDLHWRHLGELATEAFQNMTIEMGRFDVVERAQAKKFARELGYEQEHGMSDENMAKKYFALGKNVNYVIVGSIDEVTPLPTSYTPPTRDSNGNIVSSIYTAGVEVSVSARVINTSTGLTTRIFKMQGDDTHTQRTRFQITKSMIEKALKKAVNRDGRVKMAEAIPVFGYVERLMTGGKSGKNRIAYISLGENDGIKPGDEIQVMSTEEDVDPVSGRRVTRYIDVAKGNVTRNGLTSTECVMLLKGGRNAGLVKVGNVVKATAERVKNEVTLGKVNDSVKHFWQTITR